MLPSEEIGKFASFEFAKIVPEEYQEVVWLAEKELKRKRHGLSQLRYVSLVPGKSGAGVVLVETESSGTPDIPIVLKYGPVDLIQTEARNYHAFVEPKLREVPRLVCGPIVASRKAVLGYDLVGVSKAPAAIKTLREYAIDREEVHVALIIPVLQDLESWWGAINVRDGNIFAIHSFRDQEQLRVKLRKLSSSSLGRYLIGPPEGLLDSWKHWETCWPYESSFRSIVHGDLNLGNVVIDTAKHTSLIIDFACVAESGHLFQDIAKLYREIAFRLPFEGTGTGLKQYFSDQKAQDIWTLEMLGVALSCGSSSPSEGNVNSRYYWKRKMLAANVEITILRYIEKSGDQKTALLEALVSLFFHALILFFLDEEEFEGQRVSVANFCILCGSAVDQLLVDASS